MRNNLDGNLLLQEAFPTVNLSLVLANHDAMMGICPTEHGGIDLGILKQYASKGPTCVPLALNSRNSKSVFNPAPCMLGSQDQIFTPSTNLPNIAQELVSHFRRERNHVPKVVLLNQVTKIKRLDTPMMQYLGSGSQDERN